MLREKAKKVLSVLLSVALLLSLCSCTPPNFTHKKQKEIKAAGKTLAMEWLKENRTGAQLISVHALGVVDLYSAVGEKGQVRSDPYCDGERERKRNCI